MSGLELHIVISFFISFCITYLAIPRIIILSKRLRLFDSAGDRASHKGSIPVFGGIAIFIGIIFSFLLWTTISPSQNLQFIYAFLFSLFIVFLLGIIDDLLTLSPVKKIIGQIISILVIIYLGDLKIDDMHGVLGLHELPEWISVLFTIFVVIVITNGFNLIDGVDGLAGGLGVISSSLFGIIALFMQQVDIAIIGFALAGSLLGFLRYNFHPARIFMGDTGSLVVGMTLSVLAINIIQNGLVIPKESLSFLNKGPLLAIAILAIPLFDSFRVFIERVLKRRHPLYPGREHIHHALLRLGFGHNKTSLILYVFSLILVLFSYCLLEMNINISIAILAVVSFSMLFIPFFILTNRSK